MGEHKHKRKGKQKKTVCSLCFVNAYVYVYVGSVFTEIRSVMPMLIFILMLLSLEKTRF